MWQKYTDQISLLSILNKIIEKLVHKRLFKILLWYDILYKFQFEFRKGDSITLANVEIVNNIKIEISNGKFVLDTYLAISKAITTYYID